MKPSLFLSRALNMASAPPSDLVAPLAALSLEPDVPPALAEPEVLVPAALSALSPAADAVKGSANAAATAAAIRVLNIMAILLGVVRDCLTVSKICAATGEE